MKFIKALILGFVTTSVRASNFDDATLTDPLGKINN